MTNRAQNKRIPVTSETLSRLLRFKPEPGTPIPLHIPQNNGGTGFLNVNANEEDCLAVATVLEEMEKHCNCIFVIPMPVFGINPFAAPSDMDKWEHSLQVNHNIMSVHQYPESSSGCRALFSQLLAQELCSGTQEDKGMMLNAPVSTMQIAGDIIAAAQNKK